ncbi:polysaccharide polymerase domain protein [Rickettsia parkeri str. Tate's Hell]|uniref:Polysaccharide polymerase domain protein n=1 Tax=Rickettsia parkeri str. Tate's Hell TaxID=1359189 RepID=A0ABR5DN15_RICPA|nr:putative polysaccharide polymerase [Rickettsia parkeri str. AT\
MRGKTVSFDKAISGILPYEIATLLSVARNDEKTKLIH